jgi:hypothetical protein
MVGRLFNLFSSLAFSATAVLVFAFHAAAASQAWAQPSALDPADLTVPAKGASSTAAKPSSHRGSTTPRLPQRPDPGFAPAPAPAAPSSFAPVPTPAAPASAFAPAPQDPSAFRRWGATFSLHFPHPLFFEAEHRLNPQWSFGLGLGGVYLPELRLEGQPLEVNMLAADARARWHPWGGAFFVGVAAGAQKFTGALNDATVQVTVQRQGVDEVKDVYTTIKADITSLYLTPHVGWLKVFDNGLLLGVDIGVQLPVSVRSSLDVATEASSLESVGITEVQQTPQYKAKEAEVRDAVDTMGKLPLPAFTLFRVGWMF